MEAKEDMELQARIRERFSREDEFANSSDASWGGPLGRIKTDDKGLQTC